MRHSATDSAAGFQREAAPFWLRRFQRQKLKRARNAVRGNNASQPVSIAKPSMMLSSGSLETGTGSSNSLRSAKQSQNAPDFSAKMSESATPSLLSRSLTSSAEVAT